MTTEQTTEPSDHQYSFKFVLVGDSAVGKTAICKRFCENTFNSNQPQTVGLEFGNRIVEVQKSRIKLQIWDTAGQERYQSVGKAYYRNAIGVLIVFSLTDHESFVSLENWVDQVHKYCHPKVKMLLVGNKSDLIEKKAVSDNEIQQFYESHNLTYMESSAKVNINIREAFFTITQQIYRDVVSGDIVLDNPQSEKVQQNNSNQNESGCKC